MGKLQIRLTTSWSQEIFALSEKTPRLNASYQEAIAVFPYVDVAAANILLSLAPLLVTY